MTRNVSQSNALYERAKAVIPGGIYGHLITSFAIQDRSFSVEAMNPVSGM